MNKKTCIIIASVLIILVILVSIYLANNQHNENAKFGTSIAIMVYDGEVNDYVKADTIPKGDYLLNEEKSVCVAGGKISNYDSQNGTVKYKLDTADQCNIYIEMKPIITKVVSTSGDDYKITITMTTKGNNIVKYKYIMNEKYSEHEYSSTGETSFNYFIIDTDDIRCVCSVAFIIIAIDMYGNESTPITYEIGRYGIKFRPIDVPDGCGICRYAPDIDDLPDPDVPPL